MDNQEEPHRRRAHYRGTYPRHYNEKYKELHPDQYADTVAHVIDKGNTPAGMHRPICVDEILSFLQIAPGQNGLDATLGYGGHTLEMLKALQGNGHLTALDIDPVESEKTKERLEKEGFGPDILTVLHENFANLDQVAATSGPFDFILADLGVSSMQLDNPARGFSYKADGPLDLRMDPTSGPTAAQRLKELNRDELAGMLSENADEPYADQIADAIFADRRKGKEIATTAQLRRIVENALSFLPAKERKEAVKKSCQRTFQALRIDVNHEYESLYAFLTQIPAALKSGGKVAILTFHSGEDRLVKQALKQGLAEGDYSQIAKEITRASAEECHKNPRARSAKMRWAVKA